MNLSLPRRVLEIMARKLEALHCNWEFLDTLLRDSRWSGGPACIPFTSGLPTDDNLALPLDHVAWHPDDDIACSMVL